MGKHYEFVWSVKPDMTNKRFLHVNKTSLCTLSSRAAGGVALWWRFGFSCLKMAEVDNDGEHKTPDKDDLQTLKVSTSLSNTIPRLPSIIFKTKRPALIANLLAEVVVRLLFSLPSVTITTSTWLTSSTGFYWDVDSDVMKRLFHCT